jgi:hypothetical protein
MAIAPVIATSAQRIVLVSAWSNPSEMPWLATKRRLKNGVT